MLVIYLQKFLIESKKVLKIVFRLRVTVTNPTKYKKNSTNVRLNQNLLCILLTTSCCHLWKVFSSNPPFRPLAPQSMFGLTDRQRRVGAL